MNSFDKLKAYQEKIKNYRLIEFFDKDPDRANRYSIQFQDIYFDFSKNYLNQDILNELIEIANACNLKSRIEEMFTGEKINITENRAVLHTALRNFSGNPVFVDGEDVMPQIRYVREKMKKFTNAVHSGEWKGFTGKPINTIVNIGIGGSHLGPAFVTNALYHYHLDGIKVFYVSNIDADDILQILNSCNPETTLFLIASKTFTTLETMTNARTAKRWFQKVTSDEAAISKHFIALSTNEKACLEFGIPRENMFEFWDWVGGRYSLWSAIGLSISLAIGWDNFEALLRGAYELDRHFRSTPFDKNIPVIYGLIGYWYRNFWNYSANAIIPYSHLLSDLPVYFQQLDMESNGKSVDLEGRPVNYPTGQLIWGEAGTNSQHSFFQYLHQGTDVIPIDFIGILEPNHSEIEHHKWLLSNMIAQSEALMIGKNIDKVIEEMKQTKTPPEEVEKLVNHRVFAGNRPSNVFLLNKLTPHSLGKLLAIFEHKVFVQGVLWNINSFDQWGVELGKQLAKIIRNEIDYTTNINQHDSSTNKLINYVKTFFNG